MSFRPFAEQERELITELTELFTLRAEQEKSLPTRLDDGLAAAGRQHRAMTEQARTVFEQALAEAQREHAAQRERAEAEFGPRIESARTARDADLNAFRERTEELAEVIAGRREEASWLADTMLDSGMGRIRSAFESARNSIGQSTAELNRLEIAAMTALELQGYPPLAAAPAASSAFEPRAGEPSTFAARTLVEALDQARRTALRLDQLLRPPLLRGLGVAALVLGGVGVGAGIGAVMGGRSTGTEPGLGHALAGAGIGAVAGLATILMARLILRRRVPSAARDFRRDLDEARRAAAAAEHAAAATRDREAAALQAKAAREHAEIHRTIAAQEAEVNKRNREDEPRIRAAHQTVIADLRAQRDRLFADADAELARRRSLLEQQMAASIRAADDELERTGRELEASVRADRAALEEAWAARMAVAAEQAAALAAAGDQLGPRWGDQDLGEWPAAVATPPGVRFGELELDLAALPGGLSPDARFAMPGPTVYRLPLMIDLLGRGSVLLRAGAEDRDRALAVLNNIVLRLLTGVPPGKVRFTIADPLGLGQSFAGLMHLSDYEEALVGERIWTDPRQIEQRLVDLTNHMETVIQKYLRNQYETIQEYNAEAGELAEPYRFLVFADCPNAITEGAAKRLASIATSGGRCGVFLLLMTTQPEARAAAGSRRPATPASGGFPWAEIERSSMVLRLSGWEARWAEEPFASWPVRLERPPHEQACTRLLQRVGELAKDSTRVQVPFQIVEPPRGQLWSGDAASEIRLPLGRSGARKVQYLSLGRGTAQHAIVAGRTGSGKSTLLHVIVTTAALWYSPDELELYLVDFKKGVEFKTYATRELPHARVIAVESEREFGLSVLRRLDAELTRRGTAFRDAGVQDLAAFRRWQARQAADPIGMPRILLIVDEFQEFFVEDDKLAQDAGLLLDRIIRQGRAFGMHVVLGSQTLAGAYTLARSTLGQMAVRIALQCSEADSYLIMSEDNPAPRLLARPGEAIYNDASGLVEGNNPFQIVWLPDEVRESHLRAVHEHAVSEGRPRPPQIVFEGNIPGDMARNHLLTGLAERCSPPGPVPVVWLGEPLAIKEPTGVPLRHQSACNILMVGNQDEAGVAMLSAALLSLAVWLRATPGDAGTAAPAPEITLLDAAPPDLPHADLMRGLARRLGATVRLVGAGKTEHPLAELAAEVERREASGLVAHRPWLLVVNGLQRFRELRKSDDYSFSSDRAQPPSPAELFMGILRSGPAVGVHSLVWCDTATNVERMLERSALREFNSRVLMQMSAGDSTQLIDSPAASALGRHRALLYSDETGTIEKFRPYAVPDAGWLDGMIGRIVTPEAQRGS